MSQVHPQIVTSVNLLLDTPVHITILDQNGEVIPPSLPSGGVGNVPSGYHVQSAAGPSLGFAGITPAPAGADEIIGIIVTPDDTGFNFELVRTISGIPQGNYTVQFVLEETVTYANISPFPPPLVTQVMGPTLTLVVSQNTSMTSLQYQTP